MSDISKEIAEIDKLLEDLNQKLTQESKLKDELNEYISNEIGKQHQEMNESTKSELLEVRSSLSRYKQHLWNQILRLRRIRSSFVSHKNTLIETKSDLQEEIKKNYSDLSEKADEIGKKVGEHIERAFQEQSDIMENIKNLNSKSETAESEIVKLNDATESLEDCIQNEIKKSCDDLSEKADEIDKKVDDYVEKATQERFGIVADLQKLTTKSESAESEIAKLNNTTKSLEGCIQNEIKKSCDDLSEKADEIDKKVDDYIEKAIQEHSGVEADLQKLTTKSEAATSGIANLNNVTNGLNDSVNDLKGSLFDTDGYLESKLREVVEHAADNESFAQFVEKVDDNLHMKDRLIGRLRIMSFIQSALIVLIIVVGLIRMLLY